MRFVACLGFSMEQRTMEAIKNNVDLIDHIAQERIGAEMKKIFESDNSCAGIEAMRTTNLLEKILPEVSRGIGVTQNKHHTYDVYHHNLYSLKWADTHKYPLTVKVAALLHDVAKPQTKKGEGAHSTFYNHEILGASMVYRLCKRLKWDNSLCKSISLLVRHHMFYYEIDEVTERSVRRIVAKVGSENMDNLVKLRICDRMGSGVPKPEPYRLRHFQFMVEKVQKDPISVGMLKVDGTDIINQCSLSPSPRVGYILSALLERVLDDPGLNTKKYLLKEAENLSRLTDDELIQISNKSRNREKDENTKNIDEIKKKYYL